MRLSFYLDGCEGIYILQSSSSSFWERLSKMFWMKQSYNLRDVNRSALYELSLHDLQTIPVITVQCCSDLKRRPVSKQDEKNEIDVRHFGALFNVC